MCVTLSSQRVMLRARARKCIVKALEIRRTCGSRQPTPICAGSVAPRVGRDSKEIVLAQGAKRMAREQVIVKQLEAIENFGSMNVLYSDKTGTLTEGIVRLHAVEDVAGRDSESVLRAAYLNAVYESGFTNPIDAAIRACHTFDVGAVQKLDEIPYDFLRKRLSILVDDGSAASAMCWYWCSSAGNRLWPRAGYLS